ncbi:MAG: S46 family peptidase [Bacteroidales bacterium]|nr:S46 family peptidase [Lentimicrobiaceae bacterium]MDD5693917.1 S46 family peptidase [Bacteroidales bacterium]
MKNEIVKMMVIENFIRKSLIVLFMLSAGIFSRADEGMWIPLLLGEMNEEEMMAMGMRITAEDIYSVNHSSLKDAVVIFGGGCTAEIVSGQGLILTNHHCGYGSIQRNSSIEHDYLTEGFWAFSHDEEIPCPGLTCTLLIRMEDVTDRILSDIPPEETEQERQKIITERMEQIKKKATEGTHYAADIEPFFYGNAYYLFINEIFSDIRLVGAPPSSIGKFGGDTDNWMWPRHTGDFSVFRIYVDSSNMPAVYSPDNVPYTPKNHLKISLKGYQEGDFTFVFGYPGQTTEYLPSYAVEMITQEENPIRIQLRAIALGIIDHAMQNDDVTRIQYAAKQAGIANGWKKWIGENRGINRLQANDKKQQFEEQFKRWTAQDPERTSRYGSLLPAFEELYSSLTPYLKAETYLWESAFRADLLRLAGTCRNLVSACKDKESDQALIREELASLKNLLAAQYRNYNEEVDKQLFHQLIQVYYWQLDPAYSPPFFQVITTEYQGDVKRFTEDLFQSSLFDSPKDLLNLLDHFKRADYKKIEKDAAYQLNLELRDYYFNQLVPVMQTLEVSTDSLMRIYMKAQMEMFSERRFYPDANSTLRVTYGKVSGYRPADAVEYSCFTTLSGIIGKEDPSVHDYVVHEKLKDLHANEDYGRYADKDGSMHTCFIAANHTSGGNSGSPVLNADGHLIGINFDRCWEGTMSDLMYDPGMCRNISLDIRYCLFIIDKFAGAGHLINEMTLVE